MERQRIYVTNTEDRLLVASVLIKSGYTARIGREKQGNKLVCFVEYWREGNAV